jgi:ribosomal protein S18 acetylase RimI-like enzyme
MPRHHWEDSLTLRPFHTQDLLFLHHLYASVREAELAITNFSDREKEQFIAVQFQAQHQYYMQHYSPDGFNIIEIDGEPVGRFFVNYWDKEIRIVDISLIPEFRHRGIGTYLLEGAFEEARARNLPITLHVEQNNPARHLYQRLGFQVKDQRDPLYLRMEWRPAT